MRVGIERRRPSTPLLGPKLVTKKSSDDTTTGVQVPKARGGKPRGGGKDKGDVQRWLS
ncbi:hypothetical protein E1A91_A11G277200v1 [Gossypium mustelinum]|uniref:Uncharacterized protein n=1 Tax=Gossypium mustelinum TaxID=34275 RepID=A0A5D2XBR7_GOSMU|nr:hypothetical protein E1A91_A11G277200v1 [Gossypium mustelinum]